MYPILGGGGGGGGGSNPIFAHGKMFSHFFPWGKMGKKVYGKKGKSIHFPLSIYFFPHGEKVYGKRGKSIHFPLFPYTFFFPIFPHGKKWEKTHFSMGKNEVGPPNIIYSTHFRQLFRTYIKFYPLNSENVRGEFITLTTMFGALLIKLTSLTTIHYTEDYTLLHSRKIQTLHRT